MSETSPYFKLFSPAVVFITLAIPTTYFPGAFLYEQPCAQLQSAATWGGHNHAVSRRILIPTSIIATFKLTLGANKNLGTTP